MQIKNDKIPSMSLSNNIPKYKSISWLRNRKLKLFFIFFMFTGIILLFTSFYLLFSNPKKKNEDLINKRYKFGSIHENFIVMNNDRILNHPTIFLNFLKISKLDRKVKSGIYEFNNQMSPAEIMLMLFKGEVKKINLTIVEGFDLYDIANLLVEQAIIKDENKFISFSSSSLAKSLVFSHLINEFPDLRNQLFSLPDIEGFIYPDTYQISLSKPIKDLLKLSGKNFSEKINHIINEHHKRKNMTWISYFTIASLIEKETRVESEKALISSVIYNRLNKKMKLRFEPTIIYALKKLNLYDNSLKQGVINIKREHFFLRSPYNTYYNKKLPPTPISSFTLSSFQAALSPLPTKYLFFVAQKKGDANSGHYFSVTYQQHKKKVKSLLSQ